MTHPPPLPSRVLALPGGPARVVDVGEGPPILCVHGLPGSATDFRWLAAPLAGRARLVAVDLPGFGGTPVATGPDPSPEGRAAFVLAVVDALDLPPAVIVGHSMGGLVAVAAVASRPTAFRALGLLASPGLRPHRLYRRLPRGLLDRAVNGPLGPVFLPFVRWMFTRAGFRGQPDGAIRRTLACLRATSLAAHGARVRGLELPTLTAWCADDPIVDPPVLAELDGALPPGPRLRWDAGAHLPQRAHAAEVAAALSALAAPAPPTARPARGS